MNRISLAAIILLVVGLNFAGTGDAYASERSERASVDFDGPRQYPQADLMARVLDGLYPGILDNWLYGYRYDTGWPKLQMMEMFDRDTPPAVLVRTVRWIIGIPSRICSRKPTAALQIVFAVDVEAVAHGQVGEQREQLARRLGHRAVEILRRRLDALGIEVMGLHSSGAAVVLMVSEMPAAAADSMVELLTQFVQLEFRMVDDEADMFAATRDALRIFEERHPEFVGTVEYHRPYQNETVKATSLPVLTAYLALLEELGNVPVDHRLAVEEGRKWEPSGSDAKPEYVAYYLHEQTRLTGDDVARAHVGFDNFNQPMVSLEFTETGKETFAKLTEANVGKRLAIMLDGRVVSAPVVREAITGGRAQVTLGVNSSPAALMAEAQRLATSLNSGGFRAPVLVESITRAQANPDAVAGLQKVLCALPLPPVFFPPLW